MVGAGSGHPAGFRSALVQAAGLQQAARGGCGRPRSQSSFSYNSGKATSLPAVSGRRQQPLPVPSVLPCVVPGWDTAAAGQVAARDPWYLVLRMDRHWPPALLWYRHRNSLNPVLLVCSCTNLTPSPLEMATAGAAGPHTAPTVPGPWASRSPEVTEFLCPCALGATTMSPARPGAARHALFLAGAQPLCSHGPWGESLGQRSQ